MLYLRRRNGSGHAVRRRSDCAMTGRSPRRCFDCSEREHFKVAAFLPGLSVTRRSACRFGGNALSSCVFYVLRVAHSPIKRNS